MNEPPAPPAGRAVVVATDYDRTFTHKDMSLAEDALRRVAQLRRDGVKVVLVTGRAAQHLPLHSLGNAFDALVLEGGAVWGKAGRWTMAPMSPRFWRGAEELQDAGFDVRMSWASFSVEAAALAEAQRLDCGWTCSPNRDRVDVTPLGVHKGSGLQQALAGLKVTDPWVLAVGDAMNDAPMMQAAHASVAVANAEPGLAALATTVAPYEAYKGFLWAVKGMKRSRHDP